MISMSRILTETINAGGTVEKIASTLGVKQGIITSHIKWLAAQHGIHVSIDDSGNVTIQEPKVMENYIARLRKWAESREPKKTPPKKNSKPEKNEKPKNAKAEKIEKPKKNAKAKKKLAKKKK